MTGRWKYSGTFSCSLGGRQSRPAPGNKGQAVAAVMTTGTAEVDEPFGSGCGQKVLWKSRERRQCFDINRSHWLECKRV